MISRIGFLHPGLALEKLTYAKYENDTSTDSSHDDDIIYETDSILFNVQNTEDISYIQFHVKNADDFFIHHDIMTAETLTDIHYFKGAKDYVGTCGFFSDVHFYDCFMFNPVEPEFKLCGHTGYVNQMVLSGASMFTGSDDKSTIEWDMETLREKEKTEWKYEVKHVLIGEGKRVITSGEFEIGDVYKNDVPVEKMKVDSKNSLLYFGDDKGFLKCVDLRMNKILRSKKFHNEALTDFCFVDDEILSVGFDGKIIRIDKEFESYVACKTCDQLACISVDTNNKFCAYAGLDDKIKFLEL